MKTIIVNPNNTMSTIQKALDTKGSNIIFSPGIYNITAPLFIDSGVKIIGDKAILRQAGKINHLLMTRTYKNTTAYFGAHDITIEGLTFEAMAKYKTKLNLVTLWHARDVTLRNITMLDAYMFHAIEINSSKGVLVENSSFLGYYSDSKADFREQIQIDFASESALFLFTKGSKCYDNTCCEDITIRGCTFDSHKSDNRIIRPAASQCIGNHCQPSNGRKHKNILIENNMFNGIGSTNPKGCAINLTAMDNVTIRNNAATGFARFAIAKKNYKYSYDKNGRKVQPTLQDGTCKNISLINNKVTNPSWSYNAYEFYREKGC
jgi:hypothetical protein|uniref:Plasmin and fibronectin-binding protein A protein, Adhesion, Fibronectin, Plasminogen.95A n=1 Tax=Caudovirales sp. ctCiv1 TaxID=2826769 RepID=A0A8S5M8K9_9CAUD|nr:hypothetical protein [uncultured Lachnoclostridium sp.]DAD78548.1 MAG TPA: Plasmin and fibronectin-binding protein A protein, Adhesion, Fibronectin, Plasminogen.95A [Caudovirales sp. ctCiv1]